MDDVDWSAMEVRQIRYRLGCSRADMARLLGCELADVTAFEAGSLKPEGAIRNRLMQFHNEAEANSERTQRRPVAELIMSRTGLSQIHDSQVIASIGTKIPLK
jgi:predicted transcriptional regulator